VPKNNRSIAALVTVLVVAGFGGFFLLKASPAGPPMAQDRARVTGYAKSSISGQTSGAVSVELNGASAARIDQLAEGLPPASLAATCEQNTQVYRIAFTAGAAAKTGLDVTGYGCGYLVVEVPARGRPTDRIDRKCTLLSAVRRLLPATATATQRESASCASLAVHSQEHARRLPFHRLHRLHRPNPPATLLRKSVRARKYGVTVVRSAYSSGPWRPSPPMPKITASMPR
jgi:hypothetical protein